jgi:hypothetical protein
MADVVARIDDFGRPAWIALMVIGFIVFWPIGLVLLAYLLWSGRMMACGRDIDAWRDRAIARWERRRERWERRMQHWAPTAGMRPTGNRAFDEYRAQALRRLEEEASEFHSFLERLRMAKDRAEFDDFMRERQKRTGGEGGPAPGSEQPA